MRYDEEREVYRDCQWCHGRGCNQCKYEAEKAYKRDFPDGPKPIATFKLPEEKDAAKEAIGVEALRHAFGPEGRGVLEIVENCKKAKEKHGRQ